MEAYDLFNIYYEGQLSELLGILKEQAAYYAESGDTVRLSRVFSYYGVVNLICGHDFFVSTLLKQVNEEYLHGCEDPRIKASYARFLALCSSFSGRSEDASKYYEDARLLYRQTDWYPDEAVTLLESICWHYLFSDDSDEFYSALERLETLNHHLEGNLKGDLILLHSISKEKSVIEIKGAGVLEKLKMQSSSMMVKVLISFIWPQNALVKPDKNELPYAEIFRHPWYKDRLRELQSRLNGIKNIQNGSQGVTLLKGLDSADRISVNLFDKCHLSCKNTVFKLNSFGTRTGNELLLYLFTQNNMQLHKEVLIELFFPDEEPSKAYNRLYVNIHRLNKALQKQFSFTGNHDFVYIKQGIVCINPDIVEEIDTQKYRKILSVANQLWLNDKETAVDLMKQAIGMYSGDIAPGFYYVDWLDSFRLELKNMKIKALTRMLQFYRDKANGQAYTEVFYSLIELDSLNEEYYIEYIDYILKDGRDVEAVNLYNQYQTRLDKELGLTPSLKLTNLMSRVMR